MSAFSEDVTPAFSDAQMCGRSSGSEAAAHGMTMFQDKNSDAVILVDAANAFNNLNRKVLLHNIKFIYPEIATYVNNCYLVPTRLFLCRRFEFTSHEGSTQSDPLSVTIYAIGITPKIDMMLIALQNDLDMPNKLIG